MSWSRRVPDETYEHARRRLRALTRPDVPAEADLPDLDPGDGEPPAAAPRRHPWTALLPTTVRDGRVALSRSAASGLAVLAVVALALTGSYAWRARAVQAVLPASPAVARSTAVSPGAPEASPGAPSPVGEVVVDVAGKVRRPGVVRLPLGSRVVDAIAAAGGVRGEVDLTALNLARILADGEQVVVGLSGAPVASGPGAAGQAGTADAVVDLNTATLEQLDTLPGVGPVLAQRILDWRTAHGRFTTIDELREVSGIGESRFADLAPHVRV